MLIQTLQAIANTQRDTRVLSTAVMLAKIEILQGMPTSDQPNRGGYDKSSDG